MEPRKTVAHPMLTPFAAKRLSRMRSANCMSKLIRFLLACSPILLAGCAQSLVPSYNGQQHFGATYSFVEPSARTPDDKGTQKPVIMVAEKTGGPAVSTSADKSTELAAQPQPGLTCQLVDSLFQVFKVCTGH
jgi:hypothetical protein